MTNFKNQREYSMDIVQVFFLVCFGIIRTVQGRNSEWRLARIFQLAKTSSTSVAHKESNQTKLRVEFDKYCDCFGKRKSLLRPKIAIFCTRKLHFKGDLPLFLTSKAS